MKSFRNRPIGWRNESYRHYLASKGISTAVRDTRSMPTYLASKGISNKFYARRTLFHGTDERNISSIMNEGLLPKVPLWDERIRRSNVDNIRRNEKELKRLFKAEGTGRKLSDRPEWDIEGYKLQIAREKRDLESLSTPRVSLTTRPEVASRFTTESRGFSPAGKMLSDEQVGGGSKNVILKVAVEENDLVPVSAGGWNLGEFRSLKRIAPEDIGVVSDEERQQLIEGNSK